MFGCPAILFRAYRRGLTLYQGVIESENEEEDSSE
jgi:hypothetical protein